MKTTSQTERHALGRKGEDVVAGLFNVEPTNHKHPFDIIDGVYAYEVKTMCASGKDMKIHIGENSMIRKLEYANENNLVAVLVAVVLHSPWKVEIFVSPLKQHIRINQMEKVA